MSACWSDARRAAIRCAIRMIREAGWWSIRQLRLVTTRRVGRSAAADAPVTVTARGFLPVATAGEYWFSVVSPETTCLAIDKRMVLGCLRGVHEGSALLTEGVHRFDSAVRQPSGCTSARAEMVAGRRGDARTVSPAAAVETAILHDVTMTAGFANRPAAI